MSLIARIALHPKTAGGLLCQLILLTYLAMLAHEYAPDHSETDTGCSVCITKDRLDDDAINGSNNPLISPTYLRQYSSNRQSQLSADVPGTASRGPPTLS